jgi:spore coat protein U-like protein
MPMKRLACLLILLLMACFSQRAEAAINCTTSGTMNFATIDVLSGTASAVQPATFTISCTGANPNTVVASICVSLGAGSSTTWPPREMVSGANKLRFEVYKDAALTSVMGAWPAFAAPYSASTTGLLVNIPITSGAGSGTFTLYGVVLGSQQSAPQGTYTSSFIDASSTMTAFQSPNANTVQTCSANGGGGQQSPLSITATAMVSPNCSISATNLNFGTLTNLSAPTDATSSISVTCALGLPYFVSLSGGLTNATDPTARKMTSGPKTLTYGLYRDAQRSLPWGDTSNVNTLSGTGTASPQTLTVYGRIPGQQYPTPGTYTDTISATIVY